MELEDLGVAHEQDLLGHRVGDPAESRVVVREVDLVEAVAPELDQLVTDIRREFDRDKRIPMFHKLYKILQEAQPRTLLIHGRVSVILHKRFRNVIVRHKGMRSTYWWVDPKDVRY